MNNKSALIFILIVISFGLAACHDPHRDRVVYETEYIVAGDYKLINYSFSPFTTYRVQLITFSGDADLAIYNFNDELVVSSSEYADLVDEVIFTADSFDHKLEIYGHESSEYQLLIEELHYENTGLSTNFDSITFNVDIKNFSGDLYSILDSEPLHISHAYDFISVEPKENKDWLDAFPTGTIYESSATIDINILETEAPSSNNFASLLLYAEDFNGKVRVIHEVDILYQITDL